MNDGIVYATVRYGLISLGILLLGIGASVTQSDAWVECRDANPSIRGFYTCMGTVATEPVNR
jgi:hypothetical protein